MQHGAKCALIARDFCHSTPVNALKRQATGLFGLPAMTDGALRGINR
jgi:hypothetical protein